MKQNRWILAIGLLLGLMIAWGLYQQKSWMDTQAEYQQVQLELQAESLKASKNQNLMVLLNGLLLQAEEELRNDSKRRLSKGKADRFIALSHAFLPYPSLRSNSTDPDMQSPERGQLLLALVHMKMDSLSFTRIRQGATFAFADLRGADLGKLSLSGVELPGADLREAHLNGSDLDWANLERAKLGGATLNQVSLRDANLKWADLRWAEINQSQLERADIRGARLAHARLRNSHLQQANLRLADARGASFEGADLTACNLTIVNYQQANFRQANLSEAKLAEAICTEADLRKALMQGTDVRKVNFARAMVSDANWIEQLYDGKARGCEQVWENYRVVEQKGDTSFLLVKKPETKKEAQ